MPEPHASSPGRLSASAWLARLDRSGHALLLFVASAMETLVVPIPIEVIPIPWMLCHPHRKETSVGVALAPSSAWLWYRLTI